MRRVVDKSELAPAIEPRHRNPRVALVPQGSDQAAGRHQPAAAASANSPPLPYDIGTAAAFKLIAATLADTIEAHQPAVRRLDPNGVHRMRIGLRRMRAAISIFSDLVGDRESRRLKREMKWLAGRLAPARDLQLMQTKFAAASTDTALQPFLERLAADRSRAFDAARTAVEHPRFRRLLRDLRRWIAGSDWTANARLDDDFHAAKTFAKHVLSRRARKLNKKLIGLDQLDDPRRHRVRIAAKKLYYATGFFESLVAGHNNGKRMERFKKRIKKLIDALGALNDISVRRTIIDRVAKSAAGSKRLNADAARKLTELDTRDIHKQLKAAVKAASKLADDRVFGA